MTLTVEEYIALSTAAYANFNEEDKGVTVNDLLSKIPHSSESQALSLHSSLAGWKLLNFQPNNANGFAAAAFQAPSTLDANGNTVPGEIVFAFRGTEVSWQDIVETDGPLALDLDSFGEVNQFTDAYNFWLQTIQGVGGSSGYSGYSFTGHSLGGGIAQYMTYRTNEVGHAVTFNAVGVGQMINGINPSNYDDSVMDYVNTFLGDLLHMSLCLRYI